MATSDVATQKQWFKDLGYYVLWFVVWGVVFSLLQPVTQMAGTTFGAVKLQQLTFGAGIGVISAIAFALLQNTVNTQRRKWVSWLLAIGVWLTVNLLLAAGLGTL